MQQLLTALAACHGAGEPAGRRRAACVQAAARQQLPRWRKGVWLNERLGTGRSDQAKL
jgi:hypothetical protein